MAPAPIRPRPGRTLPEAEAGRHWASPPVGGDRDMVRTLLRHGADVNAARDRLPLTHAALALDLAMMDLLLEAGAKPDEGSGSSEGMSVLMQLMQAHGFVDGVRGPVKAPRCASAKPAWRRWCASWLRLAPRSIASRPTAAPPMGWRRSGGWTP
ncbi:hypothetical protein [Massilia sp. Se16.2.3]|uniref:hypothetical protein n=1 Tax=Massilia sp. Se16.2.3 TaxID=2709303 RepID=UPI0035A6EC04